jgi:hypothetical protein
MWPYWLLILGPAYLAITSHISNQKQNLVQETKHLPLKWKLTFLLITLMVGLRHQTGGDWITYLYHLEGMEWVSFEEALISKDPAYNLITWIGFHSGTGVYLVNLICAVFFTSGLIVFCRSQPQPWLGLTLAIPYLVTVVAMGYTRQGVAIGIVMIGLVALSQAKILKFIFWIALGALFHNSAIILIPLAVLASTKRIVFNIVWISLTGILLFVLLLQESVDFLIAGYLEAGYQSSGAAIRIAMNALPASIFLILRERFLLSKHQKIFWTWMAWGALFFVFLLFVSPSSTAVDRVALYWIPLQIFVGARLPMALGKRSETQKQWRMLVLLYAFTTHFVWLFFADHRMGWIPYQFYPWERLWN